jgi:hypothetical protein
MSYRHRWIIDAAFHLLKIMFSEHVTARKVPNMVKEISLGSTLYNMLN